MIAVFCKHMQDFKNIQASPANMFRRINNINDIRGIKFSGVIRVYDWYNGDDEIVDAYEQLTIKQPELFKL